MNKFNGYCYMYIRSLIALLLIFTLAACGPIYTTEYEIIPPGNEFGAMCANNCLLLKANCENYCVDRENQTRIIKKLAKKDGKKEWFDEFNFDSGGANSCSRRCTVDYHTCHTNCGGSIITHTRTNSYY